MLRVQQRFSTLALVTSPKGNLNVLGIGIGTAQTDPPQLQNVAWQSNARGEWMIPSYPVPGKQDHPIDSITAAKGGHGTVEVVVRYTHDLRLWVAARQESNDLWQKNFDSIVVTVDRYDPPLLVPGNANRLQMLAIRQKDRAICLAAWQDLDGKWKYKDHSLDGAQRYTSFTAARDAEGLVRVAGVLEDGRVKIAAWQSSAGTWAPDAGVVEVYGEFKDVLMADSHSTLFLIGILSNNIPTIIGVKARGKHWSFPANGSLTLSEGLDNYVIGKGEKGRLQLIGLRDGDVYFVSSSDDEDHWSPSNSPSRLTSGLELQNIWTERGDGKLQVIGIDRHGKPSVVLYQGEDEKWHRGRSLALEDDSGRWSSIHLAEVLKAYINVPDNYNRFTYTGYRPPISETLTHIQGMAQYKNYYIMTHDVIQGNSLIYIFNRTTKKQVHKLEAPHGDYHHPGGCQIIGDYLAIEIEKGDESYVLFYWLGTLTDTSSPILMPAKIKTEGKTGANCIGISDVKTRNGREYVIIVRSNEGMTVYRSNGLYLDDPELEFIRDFNGSFRKGESTGADSINLVTQQDGELFALVFAGNEKDWQSDYFDLYRIDLLDKEVKFIRTRSITVKSTVDFIMGFRYGAGSVVVDQNTLNIYCCGRQAIPTTNFLLIDEFDSRH
jgi:hypothetical protein